MLNAVVGNIWTAYRRVIPVRVLNGFHVRIGTHIPHNRDPLSPCDAFELGKPDGDCQTDGHYICRECRRAEGERSRFGPNVSETINA